MLHYTPDPEGTCTTRNTGNIQKVSMYLKYMYMYTCTSSNTVKNTSTTFCTEYNCLSTLYAYCTYMSCID